MSPCDDLLSEVRVYVNMSLRLYMRIHPLSFSVVSTELTSVDSLISPDRLPRWFYSPGYTTSHSAENWMCPVFWISRKVFEKGKLQMNDTKFGVPVIPGLPNKVDQELPVDHKGRAGSGRRNVIILWTHQYLNIWCVCGVYSVYMSEYIFNVFHVGRTL